jgi:hypothetical protein
LNASPEVALSSRTAAIASLLISVCAGLVGCTRVRLTDTVVATSPIEDGRQNFDALHSTP